VTRPTAAEDLLVARRNHLGGFSAPWQL
jgi:hypothetical protein